MLCLQFCLFCWEEGIVLWNGPRWAWPSFQPRMALCWWRGLNTNKTSQSITGTGFCGGCSAKTSTHISTCTQWPALLPPVMTSLVHSSVRIHLQKQINIHQPPSTRLVISISDDKIHPRLLNTQTNNVYIHSHRDFGRSWWLMLTTAINETSHTWAEKRLPQAEAGVLFPTQ